MTAFAKRFGADMKKNGPAPEAAACLYVGEVMHQRIKPFGHRFQYKVFSLLIDLDRLSEAGRLSRLFSVNRANLVAFYEKDHAGAEGASLRSYVDKLLANVGIAVPAARVLLVCYPRILGYVFNPISIYHAYDSDSRLIAMIYEVRNTFGERHSYVCPVTDGEMTPSGLRQTCSKLFHVSPFIPMGMRYQFRMLPPGHEIRWRILETDAEGPLLAATFTGRRQAMSSRNLAGLTLRIPLLTFKIVAGIHWEALRLWVKGARYIRRPAAAAPVSDKAEPVIVEAAE
ncbi:DUF1365 domain-containing protein [Rhizobium tubonense]|nr:DUF1365 domain-containing protein [Rhizobium tubonense]